jgi:hypothetical protein
MAGKKGSRRRGRWGRGILMPVLLLLLPACIVFMPTMLLVVVGMIPTAVAYIVDRDPEKTAPITVGSLNFVGVMIYAIDLWQHGNTMANATKALGKPVPWLVMYGAAAIGWALYYGIPPAVGAWMAMRAERRITKEVERQRELREEWGPEVAGDPEADKEDEEH